MKKIALSILSLALVVSLCPVAGMAADAENLDILPASDFPAGVLAGQPSIEGGTNAASVDAPKWSSSLGDGEIATSAALSGQGANGANDADNAGGNGRVPGSEGTARETGNACCDPATTQGTAVAAINSAPGHIENVTVAGDNYLGANFMQPGDYVADYILDAYALQQNSQGKDVDLWLESIRDISVDDGTLIQGNLNGFLPLASFGLTCWWQVDGESPQQAAAETRDDGNVLIGLKLSDSAVNTDSAITREYKVLCVYDGVVTALPSTFDAAGGTLQFRTNRFASFGLAYRDMRDGKQVFPVAVRDSYARESGQGEYAEGDIVTVYAGDRDGYMVEFWNASPQDGVSFTYQDRHRAQFVMPSAPVMVSITWLRIGSISDVTNVTDNALDAMLVDSGLSLAEKVLDSDAMNQLVGGLNVDIWLKSAGSVSKADTRAIGDSLGDWTLAEVMDLTLFYKVGSQEKQVHETNSPISVRLTLSDSAVSADASKRRAYKVVRVHDGKVETLPSTFDASAKTLTFETDRFSAYALAYKDTAPGVPGDAPGSATDGAPDVAPEAEPGGSLDAVSASSSLPETGDGLMAAVLPLLTLAAIAAAVLFACGLRQRSLASAMHGRHARK